MEEGDIKFTLQPYTALTNFLPIAYTTLPKRTDGRWLWATNQGAWEFQPAVAVHWLLQMPEKMKLYFGTVFAEKLHWSVVDEYDTK